MNFTEMMMFKDSVDRNSYYEYLQEFNQNIQSDIDIPEEIKDEVFDLLQEIINCNDQRIVELLTEQINELLEDWLI